MSNVHAAAFHIPVWDSNTTETTVVLRDVASGTYTVPEQGNYVIFAVADASSGNADVFISPDGVDANSGFVITDTDPGPRFYGTATAPGTVFNIHTASADAEAGINILQFYNQP